MRSKLPELDLQIERVAVGGRMIAHHDGKVVLVRGAIPGERVRVRVEHQTSDLVYAFVTDVLEPHSDRRSVEEDPRCGGHVYAHIRYERQRVLKGEIVVDALRRIGHVNIQTSVPVAVAREYGYRMRARLHVRGGRIGFLREHSHRLCSASNTGQLLPQTDALLSWLSTRLRAIRSTGIKAIDLSENLVGDECSLHFEVTHKALVDRGAFTKITDSERVRGLTMSRDRREQPILLGGIPYVSDRLREVFPAVAAEYAEITIRRHASSFFQVNRYLISVLVTRVIDQVPSGEVIDLYAGVGLFSLALAVTGRVPVTAVESHKVCTKDLRVNAEPFGENIRVVCAPVEDFLRSGDGVTARTIIVDPPRTGLSPDATNAVIRWSPARLVYVSCDVATLSRDVRRFLGSGYKLDHVEAFDMFPNTSHIETLVVLVK